MQDMLGYPVPAARLAISTQPSKTNDATFINAVSIEHLRKNQMDSETANVVYVAIVQWQTDRRYPIRRWC